MSSTDKRKDPSAKMRTTVFYSPTREEVERCSASHDKKSQRFFREESSIKFQPMVESSTHTTDEILIKGDPGMSQSQTMMSPITFSGNSRARASDNRNITPQKLVPRQSQGMHYLPSLVKGSARELEKSMLSPSIDKDSTYELIEGAMLKENKTELTKIYKAAREFQDLKLTKEKERLMGKRDSERIKAAMTKLSEDHASTMSHNVQGIRTDISHYFNERRSKSPEQTLPEVKEQFKKKFHKLLQDINDDSKLSPGRNGGFSTNRLGSNLLDNNLKSSRFLACDTSPSRRNMVFTSLHKDIRSVRTPMSKAKQEMDQPIHDKSHNSILSGQIPHKSILNTGLDTFDENVLQGLRKELPNLFSSNPSNRQEVLVLGNWLINAIKDVQDNEQLALKDKFYKADEIYNICFNELIRQVSFDCMERAELMMKVWKAYMSLSQDITDDFKEREKAVIAKANQEIEKAKEMCRKLLEGKDNEIERIKELVAKKDDIIKEKNDRIDRFNEDQSGNITRARQATEAYTRIHKLYLSLKQEYKDVNFKFEKIKGRIGAAELEAIGKEGYIDSDTSSDEESKGVPMFGTKQQKIIRKDHKDTSTEDLMTLMRTGQEVPGMSTQTDLALMHKRYNVILRNNEYLDDVIRERVAKRKLIREGELIENMRDKGDKESKDKDKEYNSAQTITERGKGNTTDRRTSILSHADEGAMSGRAADSKARSIGQSQVLDIVQEKRSFKIKGTNEPNQTLHNFNSNKLLSKADMRRDSVMSTRSDRVMRNDGENPPETGRSNNNRDPMAAMTESSETESVIGGYKETRPEEYGTSENANGKQKLVLTKTRSGGLNSKPSTKKTKKVQRNSVREAYFGVSEKPPADLGDSSGTSGQKRDDSTTTKKLLIGDQQVTVAGKTNTAVQKKTSRKKAGETGEVSSTAAAENTARAVIEGKREARREPDSFKDIASVNSLGTSNLASANEDFKSSLRSGFKPKPVDKKDYVIEVPPELQRSTKTLTVSDNLSSPAIQPYSLNIQLLSPITMKEFPAGDSLTPNAMVDLRAASMRFEDDSPEARSVSSTVSRESRPIRTVTNAIKAIKKIAMTKESDKKLKALNGIAETLAQIEEDNEAAAQLMETQEQRIVRFTNLYKIEKRKQEDLRALNRELERQVVQDGVVIENYQRLIEELSQVGNVTEVQKSKIEALVGAMAVRAKNLEAIDELKPRLDPAFGGSIMQDIRLASESPRRKLFEDQFTLSNLLPESRYKGDFMVDVVLSPGQKHLLSEKINNPMQMTLMKVKKDLQAKKVKVNHIMPVKSLLKQITIFYQEKVHQGKDNPMFKEQDMSTFVYKQFINTYGLGKYAVKKFVKFVTSLKRNLHIHRVTNFAKMLNILNDGENYSLTEARQYLNGLEFFMYQSTAGMHYPNPDHQKTHYIPFSKALEYLRFYTEQHGYEDDIYNFRKELEKLRIVDPSKVNTSGLIDLDILLEKMVARHKILANKAEQALLTGFNSADFLKEKKVRFADFLVLYKAIEGDKSEDKKIEEMFVSYCDLVEGDHLTISKEKFFAMSFDLNIFSKQKLNTYLGIKDEFEFEKKFEVFKGNWEEETQNLIANIEKGQSSLPHEIITKWKTILELIGQDIDKSEAYIRKAALIRHKILSMDITNNVTV